MVLPIELTNLYLSHHIASRNNSYLPEQNYKPSFLPSLSPSLLSFLPSFRPSFFLYYSFPPSLSFLQVLICVRHCAGLCEYSGEALWKHLLWKAANIDFIGATTPEWDGPLSWVLGFRGLVYHTGTTCTKEQDHLVTQNLAIRPAHGNS